LKIEGGGGDVERVWGVVEEGWVGTLKTGEMGSGIRAQKESCCIRPRRGRQGGAVGLRVRVGHCQGGKQNGIGASWVELFEWDRRCEVSERVT
jgi:hypothetical protein